MYSNWFFTLTLTILIAHATLGFIPLQPQQTIDPIHRSAILQHLREVDQQGPENDRPALVGRDALNALDVLTAALATYSNGSPQRAPPHGISLGDGLQVGSRPKPAAATSLHKGNPNDPNDPCYNALHSPFIKGTACYITKRTVEKREAFVVDGASGMVYRYEHPNAPK